MKKINDLGEEEFGIYEVYYDDNGKVEGTENSMTPVCDSLENFKRFKPNEKSFWIGCIKLRYRKLKQLQLINLNL